MDVVRRVFRLACKGLSLTTLTHTCVYTSRFNYVCSFKILRVANGMLKFIFCVVVLEALYFDIFLVFHVRRARNEIPFGSRQGRQMIPILAPQRKK